MPNAPNLAFSHVGIFVSDLDLMTRFYSDTLGMTITDRGDLRDLQLVFLSTTPDEHHQLVLASGRPENVDFNVVNQISFRLETLAELQDLHRHMTEFPVTDVRPMTHGIAWSIYCRDPEGNRIEIFVDSPWYVDQPISVPFDLDRDVDEILRETESYCRSLPGFAARDEWRTELSKKMET